MSFSRENPASILSGLRLRSSLSASSVPPADATVRGDWSTIARLLPYLWRYRWRVGLALAFMVGAKLSNVGVPVLLKHLVDSLDLKPGAPQALLVVPLGLLLAYGALRLSTSLFTEARELIFAKATEGTARSISLQVFRHLHDLSLRFHLERQTGGMTRDIERGTRAVHSLISYSLYSIVPTLIEVVLVLTLLGVKFDVWFAGITVAALVVYIAFTVVVTEWRTAYRRAMNELDSRANVRAIDSLMNYETVKYFGNEGFEARRYDESMASWERAAIKSQTTLSLLNVEDLLFERGIDVCHETVRHWWNRFGPVFAADIRRRRVSRMRGFRHWRWHLDEMYVKLNGKMVYLWRAVDHEGEVLESYVTKKRTNLPLLPS